MHLCSRHAAVAPPGLRLPRQAHALRPCSARAASVDRQASGSQSDLRRSLAEALQLDGSAPQGHPDAAQQQPLVTSARARLRRATSAVGSSSNGAASSRVRRGSSKAAAVIAGTSEEQASASQAEVPTQAAHTSAHSDDGPAPLATPEPAAAAQQPAAEQQPARSSSPAPAAESGQRGSRPESGQDAGSRISESDKELQAEFMESRCCQDVLDIVADEAPRFSPFHTVTALSRLAKLAKAGPREERAGLLRSPAFASLLARLYQQAAALNPFQLSNCLYSCAVLQVPLAQLRTGDAGAALLNALEAAAGSQVKQYNDRDVSSSLYAYASLRLRRQQSQALLGLLCRQAQSLLDRGAMSPQSTSMALWAAATLGLSCDAASGLARAAARQLAGMPSLEPLGSQGVANSLWGLAKLGVTDVTLLAKGTDWLAAHMERAKVQELLNVLWADGAGRYCPPVLGRIAKHVAAQAQALKPADIASLWHVLGIFGFDFSRQPALLEALLASGAALLPAMRPFELTSLLWGLGMTRTVDCELFGQAMAAAAALATQQADAQAALAALQAARAGAGGDGGAPPAQQPSQQERAALHAAARQLPASLQRQAFQAYIAARLEGAAVQLPAPVLEAFKASWLAGNARASQQQPLLADLAWLLEQLRVKARVGGRSKLDGLLAVDVALVASGQRLVALQLLDEHAVDSAGRKLASVLWEEDVLRRNGYDEVYWLRVADWTAVPKDKRPRFLADLLRRLGISSQERLLLAAERAWVAGRMHGPQAGGRGRGRGGAPGGGPGGAPGEAGMVGASGIRAAEADLLMRGEGSSSGSGSGGGWAGGSGRGSRSSARRQGGGGSGRRR